MQTSDFRKDKSVMELKNFQDKIINVSKIWHTFKTSKNTTIEKVLSLRHFQHRDVVRHGLYRRDGLLKVKTPNFNGILRLKTLTV